MATGSEFGRAFDWRTAAQHIQEYFRVSNAAGIQDLCRLFLLAPRAHREVLQSSLGLIEHQIDALDGLQLGPNMPGARVLERVLEAQKYSMHAQAEILKGYLALVDGTLHLLGGAEASPAEPSPAPETARQ